MHRFFVTNFQDDRVVFSPEQAHQISAVLRIKVGQRVIVLDNQGWEFEVELVEVKRKRVTAVIRTKHKAVNEPRIQLTLYQSILKRDKFEWVLQKATEIGVTRFVPLITERTVAQAPHKSDRWQRILTEAAEQSKRGRIPGLAEPVKFGHALAEVPVDQTALMPWVEASTKGVGDVLGRGITAVSIFIGPEGGFTDDEIESARHHGIIPITLGRRILRSETAAIVTATLVLHELGELV